MPRAEASETVRQAPRSNTRRKKAPVAPRDTTDLRRNPRRGTVAEKAYYADRPPANVQPPPSLDSQVRHVVPYLPGQEDIPHSDEEHDVLLPDAVMHGIQPSPTNTGFGENAEAQVVYQTELPVKFSERCETELQAPPLLAPVAPSEPGLPFPPSNQALGVFDSSNGVENRAMSPSPVSPPAGFALSRNNTATVDAENFQILTSEDAGADHSASADASTGLALAHATHPSPDLHLSTEASSTLALLTPTPADGPDVTPPFTDFAPPTPEVSNLVSTSLPAPSISSSVAVSDLGHVQLNTLGVTHLLNPGFQSTGPTKRHVHNFIRDWYRQNRCRIFQPKQATSERAAQPDNRKLRQGDFSTTEQKVLQAVEHFYHFEIISADPFTLDLDLVVPKAFEYAYLAKSIRLEEASPAFTRFLGTKSAHKRGDIVDIARPVVFREYGLKASPRIDDVIEYRLVESLLTGDSFANNPAPNLQPNLTNNVQDSQKFRHPAIAAVLLAMMFDMSFKFGVVFIDKLCARDTEKWWHRERKDKSPEALEGIPVETIAFACTLIQYFLHNQKLQTVGDQLAHFEGRYYGPEWRRHMRRLVSFSQLGQLRRELLEQVKARYMQENPYDPNDDDTGEPRIW